MSDVDLRVDWCSYEAAKYAVEHWHYSRTMPAGRNNYIGVWECGEFAGAVIFGYSISPQLGKEYRLEQTELTELRRVALRSHKATVSSIVSRSVKLLKEKNPFIRLIISFSDTEQGHHGGIYQAGNWLYVGSSIVEQRLINGEWRNDVHANRMNVSERRAAKPKHKYLYPLDRAMRRQIEPLRKPYPKRVPSVQGDTVGDQPTEAGSSPAARSIDSTTNIS